MSDYEDVESKLSLVIRKPQEGKTFICISNIEHDKKSIHFKLRTDIHAALRTTLFKHNITMQELFD